MKIIIYEARNKLNGKCYYGQTIKTLEERKEQHLKESRNIRLQHIPFKAAILKYTIDGFTWKVIEECKSQEEADEREQYFISQNGDYNVAPGGIGGLIYLNKQDEKKRIEKILNTKKQWSDEYRQQVYKFTQTAEFKDSVRKRVSGKGNFWYGKRGYWAGKTNEKHSQRMIGRKRGPMSNETKRKLSEVKKGKKKVKTTSYTLKHTITNEVQTLSASEWTKRGIDIGYFYRTGGITKKGKQRISKKWILINPTIRSKRK